MLKSYASLLHMALLSQVLLSQADLILSIKRIRPQKEPIPTSPMQSCLDPKPCQSCSDKAVSKRARKSRTVQSISITLPVGVQETKRQAERVNATRHKSRFTAGKRIKALHNRPAGSSGAISEEWTEAMHVDGAHGQS